MTFSGACSVAFRHLENGKVHRTVCAVVHKARQAAEIMCAVVLDNNDGAGRHSSRIKNSCGYGGKSRHVVGRVGKHDVVGPRGCGQEAQGIAAYEVQIGLAELCCHFFDKIVLYRGFFNSRYTRRFTRQKFDRYGAGAGKEVQDVLALNVGDVFEHIKYVLAREVGCGSRRDIGRHVESPAAVFSSYYSHNGISSRGRGADRAVLSPR